MSEFFTFAGEHYLLVAFIVWMVALAVSSVADSIASIFKR